MEESPAEGRGSEDYGSGRRLRRLVLQAHSGQVRQNDERREARGQGGRRLLRLNRGDVERRVSRIPDIFFVQSIFEIYIHAVLSPGILEFSLDGSF